MAESDLERETSVFDHQIQNWTFRGFRGLDFFASMAQFLSTCAMLGYVIVTKRRAEAGSAGYAKRLVLPVYIHFLYVFALAALVAGVAHLVESAVGETCTGIRRNETTGKMFLAAPCCAVTSRADWLEGECTAAVYNSSGAQAHCKYDPGGGPINTFLVGLGWKIKAFIVAMDWALFHVVLEGLAFFLMQKGAGGRAFRRAVKYSSAWGVVTFLAVFEQQKLKFQPKAQGGSSCEPAAFISRDAAWNANGVMLMWNILLTVGYAMLRFAPEKWLSRRPAAKFYASFMLVLRATYVFSLSLQELENETVRQAGFVLYSVGHFILFSFCEPLCVWLTLQRDSEYWRGHTSKLGKSGGGNLNLPLVGRVSLNEGAASTLADTLDAIGRDHSYVEMLNFAYLTIDHKDVIGAGGTAKVYRGTWKGDTVAIKLVYPPELTQEEVEGFLREASALEAAGRHENIIKVIGVCVLPPSIALVLELCEQGDLCTHLAAQQEKGLLTERQQVELAIDCATGVEFLHSHTPNPIVHNDLKSFNVLVKAAQTSQRPFIAKLADLEFAQGDLDTSIPASKKPLIRTDSAMARPPPIPDTVNWTAPELMQEGAPGWPSVESDNWALGCLIFEIFQLQIPYAEAQCAVDLGRVQQQQREAGEGDGAAGARVPEFYGREYLIARICDHSNPLLPPLFGDSDGRPSSVPEGVSPLLAACWAAEPGQRLSARSLKEGLHARIRMTPERTSTEELGTLRGVGLPVPSELRVKMGSASAVSANEGQHASPRSERTLSEPPLPDGAESPGSEPDGQPTLLSPQEARSRHGVGARRSRQISDRGVGLPTGAAILKRTPSIEARSPPR